MSGMLRAARRKPASTSAPSMNSAFLRPSLSRCDCNALVLPSVMATLSSTMMPPSLALADRAGALLPIHLLAGAVDLGAVLDIVGASLTLGQLPHHAALQDVGARLEAEDVIRHGDAASRLTLERRDLQFHLTRPPSLPQPARRPRAGTCPASANLLA